MNSKLRILSLFLVIGLLSFLNIGGCDNNNNNNNEIVELLCAEPNVDISVCDPENGPFSLEIDNEFFPLVVGMESVLEGEDDEGAEIMVTITVTPDTLMVAGVETRIVEEDEFEDGERVETSWNYYAQAPDGTVCYFGEDVDIFEDGEVVAHTGAWRAGEDGNLPGIIMEAVPQIGDIFKQEDAPDVAEDQSEIVDIGEELDLGELGVYDDTVTTEDCNPFDGSMDDKVYISGIGLAKDEDAELVSFEPGME